MNVDRLARIVRQTDIDTRMEILRRLLVEAIGDTRPIYEGVNHDGKPYQGPSLGAWVIETTGYFAYNRVAMAPGIFQAGLVLCKQHEAMSKQAHKQHRGSDDRT